MDNIFTRLFGNMMNFKNQFDLTKNQLAQTGNKPEQVVQQMLDEGKMTQEQFNICRSIANSIMGTKN